ncbi:MAG: hypothetical protein JWN30_1531 [Bacilli bacterium]|nr:hypothetical protein [Bacilli bacterium]
MKEKWTVLKIFFEEQDLIDAVCVYTAEYERVAAEHVRAELFFTEGQGFSAQPEDGRNGRLYARLTEQNMIDAVATYLRDYHQFDPTLLGIELFFENDKGFWAVIDTRS